MLFDDDVFCRFNASGLHTPFFFRGQRTHFKIAKGRPFCEVVLREVDGHFYIVFVSQSVIERTCSGAAVYTQKTMSSYLPKPKNGIPVIATEPSMRPIACLCVLRCLARHPTLLTILRRTCYCGGHENQSEQN